MDGSTTTTEQKIKSDGTRIVEDNKGQEAVENHDRLSPDMVLEERERDRRDMEAVNPQKAGNMSFTNRTFFRIFQKYLFACNLRH